MAQKEEQAAHTSSTPTIVTAPVASRRLHHRLHLTQRLQQFPPTSPPPPSRPRRSILPGPQARTMWASQDTKSSATARKSPRLQRTPTPTPVSRRPQPTPTLSRPTTRQGILL